MATATFDKNIVIGNKAAKRMIEVLNKPVPPRPSSGKDFWENNERVSEEWLSNDSEG
ncbi:MAG: hypothetical protein LBI54_07915 [Lachnospiraceae bacterium]|jgi:hypothetical protein|nr:hypothetical protein [Lachnospiraceae bacterium]